MNIKDKANEILEENFWLWPIIDKVFNEIRTYKHLNACLREAQNKKLKHNLIEKDNFSILTVLSEDEKKYEIYYGVNLSLGVRDASKTR